MTFRLKTLATIGLMLVAAAPVVAQSMQTGEITGIVKDKAGKPIPGARIRARSEQTERTAVTGAAGEFRLPLMNVGTWAITLTKDGFQVATAKVYIAINETKIANFSLVPQEQTVVVVVDALGQQDTTTAQVATSMSAKDLEAIPMNMTSMNALDGIMSVVPGVQVSQSGTFQIMGGAANENVYVVDGNLTNMTYDNKSTTSAKAASVQPAREFLESVEVVTKAFGAEYGVFGGAVNALTKSGTNTFEGSLFYRTNFPHSAAMPFYQDKMVPTNPRTPEEDKYHRYGFTASGPIIKDRLFFFVGFQGFKDVVPPQVFETGGSNWDGMKSDNTRVTGPNQWTAKLNWFVNPDHQLILSATRSHFRSNTGHQWATYGTVDFGTLSDNTYQTVNLTWNWTPSPDLFLVASVGNFKNPSRVDLVSGATYPTYFADGRYFLTGPGRAGSKPSDPAEVTYLTGTGGTPRRSSDNPNTQYKLDLSWILGASQIKAGYLRQETDYREDQGGITTWFIRNAEKFGPSADTLMGLRTDPTLMDFKGVIQSFYLKDNLEVRPGLRLDIGVRAETYVYKGGIAPFTGVRLAAYDSLTKQLQPRLGLIWDVDQDGKHKVYAHFGRSFVTMPMNIVSWATLSGLYLDSYKPGAWSYNADYQNGTPVTFNAAAPTSTIFMAGGAGTPTPHATDLRIPRKNTWTVGSDWTLGRGWSAGASWTFWEMKDILDDSYFLNNDNTSAFDETAGAKVTWNPGPGTVDFVDSYGVTHSWTSNFPTPRNRYIGGTLYANQKGDRHAASLSYTWTHHYGNYGGENASNGNVETGRSQEFDYAQAISGGNIEADPVHMLKFNGSYRFIALGHEFDAGMTALWQSGTGLTAMMPAGGKWVADENDYSFGGIYLDPVNVGRRRGDLGRTPSLFQLNLDLGTAFKFRQVTVQFNATVSNVFNSRTRTSYITTQYLGSNQANLRNNPNFLLADAAVPGRAVTAGCSIQF